MPSLADVLPAVAASVGAPAPRGELDFPAAPRAVIVLVDGLGHALLSRRRGHAPFLRSHLGSTLAVPCGFPSTTATSMATFGTGLLPGAHGLLGYEVLDPDRDVVFNELNWEDGPTPEAWQPHPTLFEAMSADGVAVSRIGPHFFDGSGLTRAALRGGSFVAAKDLQSRVDATVNQVRSSRRAVSYLYWGEVDKIGHVHGCESWQWGDELEVLDAALAQLHDRLPPDCSLTITADQGMVDLMPDGRVDVASTPGMAAGVRHVAGDPRALQLHCEPGAVDDVAATWQAILGAETRILGREEAIRTGLFGPVAPRVRSRIGDLLVLASPGRAVVDSRRHRPELIALVGHHGSTTADEVTVPVLHLPARVA